MEAPTAAVFVILPLLHFYGLYFPWFGAISELRGCERIWLIDLRVVPHRQMATPLPIGIQSIGEIGSKAIRSGPLDQASN